MILLYFLYLLRKNKNFNQVWQKVYLFSQAVCGSLISIKLHFEPKKSLFDYVLQNERLVHRQATKREQNYQKQTSFTGILVGYLWNCVCVCVCVCGGGGGVISYFVETVAFFTPKQSRSTQSSLCQFFNKP